MQFPPKQLKPASRWFTRLAIGFALACSVFLAGNADASVEDDVRVIRNYCQSIEGNTEATANVVQALLAYIRLRSYGSAVTNFLGEDDLSALEESLGTAIWDIFDERYTDGAGTIYVMPYSEDYMDMGYYLQSGTSVTGPNGTWYAARTVADLLQVNSLYTYYVYRSLTNAAGHVETISRDVSSNVTTVASVYEKLDALESTPTAEEIQESTDADTYTNAVPVSPLALGSVDVDTSSMDSVLDPITDGLDGLIPTESTTKPKIVMMQGNRSGGNVEVELNLDGLEAVTRILRVLYKVGLWVGVIGILRSEWAFWSTLGGSAT